MSSKDGARDNPIFYYAFQVLFWCGLRLGELLALTLDDIDFENATLNIRHSYQTINGEAYLSDTKTVNGIRKVYLPQRLVEELQGYTNGLYIKDNKTHIFPVSKSNMHNIMNKGCEECGVKRITIHGLRHPYVKLKLKFLLTQHYRCIGAKVLDFPLNFKLVVGVNIHLVYKHICEFLCQGVFLFHCFCCLQSF